MVRLSELPIVGSKRDPDIIDVIKAEHGEVAAMLGEIEKLEPGSAKLRDLAEKLETALGVHATLEERLFYPRLRDRAEEDDERVDVFEAYTEHDVMRHLIALLKSRRKRDPERFKAELQVLSESVKHHVREEESKIFSLARELIDSDERAELGTKWRKLKAQLMPQARRPRGPRTRVAQNGRKAPKRKAAR